MCDGDAKNPKPKKNLNEMTEIHMKGENPKTKKKEEHRVRLKEWMEKLPKGQDLLAEGDAVIDKQVGGGDFALELLEVKIQKALKTDLLVSFSIAHLHQQPHGLEFHSVQL